MGTHCHPYLNANSFGKVTSSTKPSIEQIQFHSVIGFDFNGSSVEPFEDIFNVLYAVVRIGRHIIDVHRGRFVHSYGQWGIHDSSRQGSSMTPFLRWGVAM
ncbi:hypothetical protein A2U01_0043146 [Trifolium medium]|uniref:Uncharacterized protein n=1 Tax=Trifolium medium TaxID=97028 RepID=A0A392QC77_9FABA|nr:hypothetical protein [Trifolium medium]